MDGRGEHMGVLAAAPVDSIASAHIAPDAVKSSYRRRTALEHGTAAVEAPAAGCGRRSSCASRASASYDKIADMRTVLLMDSSTRRQAQTSTHALHAAPSTDSQEKKGEREAHRAENNARQVGPRRLGVWPKRCAWQDR
eukprot:4879683-Pleurochrysis_carterae.AAC.2